MAKGDGMIVKVKTEEIRGKGVRWTIWVNGDDHGGGTAKSHSGAYQDAAFYLRDMEMAEGDRFLRETSS